MKKICYFINSDWYFELHWAERARAAAMAGYEIHVISRLVNETIKEKLMAMGMICHHSGMIEQSMNPLNFFHSFLSIWALLKDIRPDTLHCITIKSCLIGGFFACWYRIPIILSFVGLGRVFITNKFPMKLIRFLTIYLYKFIVKNGKCFLVFEHEHDRNTLLKLIRIDSVKTVIIDGAGINPGIYRYSLETSREKPVVLFASRLLWSKGLGDLVEVKKRLSSCGIDFELNVAGISVPDDSDAIPLEKIEKWHRQSLINWLGKRNDIYHLIVASNIVALPSVYSEGIPRILLEAASVGRASIAYDIGGCQSLIIDDYSGSLVEKCNVDCLTEKLSSLLTSPAKRFKMGIHSRTRIEKKFSSSLIINDTLKLYLRTTSSDEG